MVIAESGTAHFEPCYTCFFAISFFFFPLRTNVFLNFESFKQTLCFYDVHCMTSPVMDCFSMCIKKFSLVHDLLQIFCLYFFV